MFQNLLMATVSILKNGYFLFFVVWEWRAGGGGWGGGDCIKLNDDHLTYFCEHFQVLM